MFACLFVCLFSHDISKTNANSITKLGTRVDMDRHKSWKRGFPGLMAENTFNLELKVKGQGYEAQKHCRRGSQRSCDAGFFLLLLLILEMHEL